MKEKFSKWRWLDNTGTVVVKYVYDAWGCYKILSPDGTEITDGAHIGKKNPFRYRGYYYSEALELYALAARFYDPKIGRFICADTVDYLDPESPNGLNLFAYCNNNPVMYSDPSGHFAFSLFRTIATATLWLVKSIIKGSVGVTTSTGKEIPDPAMPVAVGPFVTVETGIGYSKDFGNEKSVNLFIAGDSFTDFSVGLDATINGYGASIEAGVGQTAIGMHLGAMSLEIGVSAGGNIYYKNAIKTDKGYSYTKISFKTTQFALNIISAGLFFGALGSKFVTA